MNIFLVTVAVSLVYSILKALTITKSFDFIVCWIVLKVSRSDTEYTAVDLDQHGLPLQLH